MTETIGPSISRAEKPPDTEDYVPGREPSLLRLLLNWRDWNIPTKLAAVTLVPVVFAIVLGAMQIGDQVDRADSYRWVDRLVEVNEQLRPLTDGLQRERTATTALLAMGQGNMGTLSGELADEQDIVNTALQATVRAAGRASFHTEITKARFGEVSAQLGELPVLRREVAAGRVDAPNALTGYTVIINSLLNFNRAAAAEVLDPALASTAVALHDLEVAKEEIRYQQALVGLGLANGRFAEEQLGALHASQARLSDRLAEFRTDANLAQQQDFSGKVNGSGVAERENLVQVAMSSAPGHPLEIDGATWHASSDDAADRTAAVTATLGTQIERRSGALQDEASNGAGLASVLLLMALVVAVAVMIVIGRHLLGSLNVLRTSALDVAEHGLPRAVERIRDSGGVQEPVVEPVPVRSADEVGQVARAFDAVHRQALRLATEQAGLRARYGDVFVNLSRRSQGLVQRQLQLLERLERDEEDPEQLATLFQLDHLATRMRRNNENLMVLSGAEPGRRNQRPAPIADLLRAAVSEIEQYQRVSLLPPPDVLIVGYAVGDLVRLVAELLDNATAFSAPGTQVTIASHSFEDGTVCVAILDEGIGMSEAELAAANAKLANAGTVDVSTSRRMGLFVVGRLASRHGVEVSLHGGKNIQGVRATVTLPADLVTTTRPEQPTAAFPAPTGYPEPPVYPDGLVNGSANGAAHHPQPDQVNGFAQDQGTLPRRRWPAAQPDEPPPVNGVSFEVDAPEPVERRPEPPAVEDHELPRRVPGQFAPPPDLEAGPVERIPEPDSDWWSVDPQPAPPPLPVENTPIFDEMISAWFRSISDHTADESWNFAADVGFQAAQEISQSQPDDFTDSGLPRRKPRQNLLPGSAGRSSPQPDGGAADERPADGAPDSDAAVAEAIARIVAEPVGVPLIAEPNGTRLPAAPAEVTAGGLPRRMPRATQPAAAVEDGSHGGGNRRPQLDRAVELRSRLGNLQRGLSKGRRSVGGRPRTSGDEIAAGAGPVQDDKESE
ncbi:nitrate- and nitrite sensing domain-containing protein [Actinophytocola sp.]|uniref:nitrate- and nitrite sensing domain-containing protein n=1 Tax=Actinophytocola sp. TaxID=1872138 RepID=UPI002D801751|nr:nitrate- and nitrite sensing domain-containing protein [Actinophytocola sp.]HET9140142.1 nitrate- and nitrite sensing domain-containing protein [Actinophytocola sp.]